MPKPAFGRVCMTLALLLATAGPAAAGDAEAPPLAVVRLAEDAGGRSYFEEATLPLSMRDYAPPAGPIAIHTLAGTRSATFVYMPGGGFEDWHPAPRRQYAVIVRGQVEVTAGTGEMRRFGPGEIVLLDDTAGQGHQTRVISEEPHLAVMVAVDGGGDD